MARLQRWTLRLFTWSYHNSLHYSTIRPIQDIADCQQNRRLLRERLVEFRHRKEQEFKFVSLASGLSVACTVQVFSWSSIAETFWLANLLWQCSLLASIAALVSSAQSRVFYSLPNSTNCSDEDVLRGLKMVLREINASKSASKSVDRENKGPLSEAVEIYGQFEKSRGLIYFWQSPLMLMSWSWVFFLLALSLHIATPLIKHNPWSINSTASVIALLFGLLIFINFQINAVMAHQLTIINLPREAESATSSCMTTPSKVEHQLEQPIVINID